MWSLGRLGLALSMAGLATAASAAPDPRPPLPADDLNATQMDRTAPNQPDGPPPPRGAWNQDGWSDSGAPSMRDRGAGGFDSNGSPSAPPRQARGSDVRRMDTPGRWRRETWDGGRGDAFAYRRGGRLPPIFASPDYAVPDWQPYGLVPPGPGRHWARYYDDAVLIDAPGTVIDAVPLIGWEDQNPRYDHRGGGAMGWHPAPPYIYHRGSGPAPQVYYNRDGATTIVITTAPSVVTTTTRTTTHYVTMRRRVWHAQTTKLVQARPSRPVQTKTRRTVQTKRKR
jgi:Ni/Co efflux regulator RcnB